MPAGETSRNLMNVPFQSFFWSSLRMTETHGALYARRTALVPQSSWSEPSRDGYAFHRMRSGVDDGLMRHPDQGLLYPNPKSS